MMQFRSKALRLEAAFGATCSPQCKERGLTTSNQNAVDNKQGTSLPEAQPTGDKNSGEDLWQPYKKKAFVTRGFALASLALVGLPGCYDNIFLPHSFWLHLYCLHSRNFYYSLIVYNIFFISLFWSAPLLCALP